MPKPATFEPVRANSTIVKAVKSILIAAIATYLGFVGLLYFMQRGMMYPGDGRRTAPGAAGLVQAAEELLTTS
jgi:hypothetical protein